MLGKSSSKPGSNSIVVKASGTTIPASETAISSEIDVSGYDEITLYVDYTKGDETNLLVYPKILRESGGDEHPSGAWTNNVQMEFVQQKAKMDATGKFYITYNTKGIHLIKLYADSTAGTPTGTYEVSYSLIERKNASN